MELCHVEATAENDVAHGRHRLVLEDAQGGDGGGQLRDHAGNGSRIGAPSAARSEHETQGVGSTLDGPQRIVAAREAADLDPDHDRAAQDAIPAEGAAPVGWTAFADTAGTVAPANRRRVAPGSAAVTSASPTRKARAPWRASSSTSSAPAS